jgi:hypothetical protein
VQPSVKKNQIANNSGGLQSLASGYISEAMGEMLQALDAWPYEQG